MKKKLISFLIAVAIVVSLFSGVGTIKAEAVSPTWMEAYAKASYEMVSPNFTMTVSGTPVDVVQYFYKENVRVGYSYAHLAYEGTATFEITCLQGNIEAVDASPHSYNMNVKIDGNKFTFDLEQKNSRYMVFDVRANDTTYQLIVAADPDLKLEEPGADGKMVVNAQDGITADGIDVGGLSSSDQASQGKRNTEKIQKIITWLSKNGGGTLYFPKGVYSFVTIDATSNVTLYLDEGAVLRGSGIRTDYDWNTTGQNGIQAKKRDIRIENVKNFRIIGKGMVDANSIVVSQKGKTSEGSIELNDEPQPDDWYPDGWNDYRKGIVDGDNSDGIEFIGVTFKDATGWTFNIRNSRNINMHNVKMLDDYTVVHSDGYDIVSCQDVLVENCLGVCGDDVFCPKGDISGTVMKNYLFKDCVAYAEGGAGCKIGVQARSDVSNIEFNNIDVIRGYRGFTIAHDEGNGNWDGIRFIDIRTEKLHIPNFSTTDADNYGQYTATPFTLWLRSNGSVKNVEVTNCSFESISNMRAMIKGKSDKGIISDVTFNNLTMDGRTVTSLDDPRLSVGSYVDEASFQFNNEEVYNPTTMVYEAENAILANGAKTSEENEAGQYSNAYKVSQLGLINGKEGTATFTVNVEKDGKYDVEVYGITEGPRVFYITVNDELQKVLTCNGDGWRLQGRAITKLQLKAGENIIKLGNPYDAAPDLDKIEIITDGSFYDYIYEQDKEKAESVIQAINTIGTVSLDSETGIKAAREAYDKLSEEQQSYVTNYEDLVVAEQTHEQLSREKKEADQKAADAVMDAIESIGTVTLDSEVKLAEIREAYEALTEDQKKLVTNYKDLETAESELVTQKEENQEGTTGSSVVSKGEVYKYKNVKYKVTNANMKGKGTVEVIGLEKKTKKTVTIPATVKVKGATFKVTSIRKNAFKNCKKLKKVTIGKNITKIGKSAFSGCSKLKTIKIQTKNLKSVGKKAFKGIHKNAKIKVPSSKLKKYKSLLKNKGQSKSVKITK